MGCLMILNGKKSSFVVVCTQSGVLKKDIKTKALNLSKDLQIYYGLDLKKLFNWNPELVCEINNNYEEFWSHIIKMNPSELNQLTKLLEKSKIKK